MTWFLIILNLAGGQPTFIEMADKATCEAAVLSTEANAPLAARTWCIPGGEWPALEE